jgi:hypothetical protein
MCRKEENFKIDLINTECKDVNLNELAQDRV